MKFNPSFLPKVPTIRNIQQVLEFRPFGKNTRTLEGTQHAICVCRAISAYVDRARDIRKTDQLFVTFKKVDEGKQVSSVMIATWLKKAIRKAYLIAEKVPPEGFKAHGVRAQSATWANLRCASLMDICQPACWKNSNTFTRHYKLDLPRSVSRMQGQLILQAADEL